MYIPKTYAVDDNMYEIEVIEDKAGNVRLMGPRKSGDHLWVYDFWPDARTPARACCVACGLSWPEGGMRPNACTGNVKRN